MANIKLKIGGENKAFDGITKIIVQTTGGGTAVYHLGEESAIPDAPILTLTAASDTYPNGSLLTWTEVDGAAGYKIYSNGTYIPRPDESITTYDMSMANIAGTYLIYVTAYNDAGESEASNTVTFIVKPKLATPVIALT